MTRHGTDRGAAGIDRRTLLRTGALSIGLLGGCLAGDGGGPDTTPPATKAGPTTSEGRATTGGTATTTRPAVEEHCTPDPSIDVDDPLAVSFDSRGAFRCRGRPFENFEGSGRWIAEEGGASTTTEDAFEGSRSLVLTATRRNDRGRIVARFEDGIDLSGRDLSLVAKLDTPAQESLYVQLLAPDREHRLVMKHPMQRQWGWTRLDLGPTEEFGEPDLADVREMRVGMYTGGNRTARFKLDAVRTTRSAEHGSVILTFDDGKTSQFETAFPILERRGLPGVAGIIPWAVGERSDVMTVDQIRSLREAGWDVVSHPQRGIALSELSPSDQLDAIRGSKQWLIDRGFEDSADFLIWPFGEFDQSSLRIASQYHHLGFCGALSPSGRQFTGPLTLTRANANDLSFEEVVGLVDLAAEYGQLLVVTFHQIDEGDDYVTEKRLERILDRIEARDLDVVTPSELWAEQAPDDA